MSIHLFTYAKSNRLLCLILARRQDIHPQLNEIICKLMAWDGEAPAESGDSGVKYLTMQMKQQYCNIGRVITKYHSRNTFCHCHRRRRRAVAVGAIVD